MYAWPVSVSAAALLKGNLVNNRGYAKFFASFSPLHGAASQVGTDSATVHRACL